jgi:hypothetical protein
MTYRCLEDGCKIVNEIPRCDFDKKVLPSIFDTDVCQLCNVAQGKMLTVISSLCILLSHLTEIHYSEVLLGRSSYSEGKKLDVGVLVANAALECSGCILGRDLLGSDLVTDLEIQCKILCACRQVF